MPVVPTQQSQKGRSFGGGLGGGFGGGASHGPPPSRFSPPSDFSPPNGFSHSGGFSPSSSNKSPSPFGDAGNSFVKDEDSGKSDSFGPVDQSEQQGGDRPGTSDSGAGGKNSSPSGSGGSGSSSSGSPNSGGFGSGGFGGGGGSDGNSGGGSNGNSGGGSDGNSRGSGGGSNGDSGGGSNGDNGGVSGSDSGGSSDSENGNKQNGSPSQSAKQPSGLPGGQDEPSTTSSPVDGSVPIPPFGSAASTRDSDIMGVGSFTIPGDSFTPFPSLSSLGEPASPSSINLPSAADASSQTPVWMSALAAIMGVLFSLVLSVLLIFLIRWYKRHQLRRRAQLEEGSPVQEKSRWFTAPFLLRHRASEMLPIPQQVHGPRDSLVWDFQDLPAAASPAHSKSRCTTSWRSTRLSGVPEGFEVYTSSEISIR